MDVGFGQVHGLASSEQGIGGEKVNGVDEARGKETKQGNEQCAGFFVTC